MPPSAPKPSTTPASPMDASFRRTSAAALRNATTSPVPRVWVAALIIGALSAFGAIGFWMAIGAVQWAWLGDASENLFRIAHQAPWWQVLAGPTLAGLLVGLWLQYVQPGQRAEGVADVIEARALGGARIPLWRGLGSALVAFVSLGAGASAGREGPAVHLGSTFGSWLGTRFGFDTTHVRTLLAAGAAAAVAASFNAPIAGAVFGLEVVLGHYALRASGPIVIASVTGALVTRVLVGNSPTFELPQHAITSLWDFPAFAVLGVLSALVAIGFMVITMKTDNLARRIDMPLWLRPAAGGLVIGVIGIWFPQALGVGYAATDAALREALPLMLMVTLVGVKIVATAVTLGSRFGGGVFSPSLYLGAMTGGAFGLALSIVAPEAALSTHGTYAIVGMGAVAGAVLGAPLSTLLIAFELTGGYEMTVALMLAISIATALTQGLLGRSFFHWQLERRGLRLQGGPRWRILHSVLVRDFMERVQPTDDVPLQELDEDDARLFTGDTLEKALAVLEAEELDRLPVVAADDDDKIVGVVTHAGALRAYNEALVEASREEHE